MTAITGLAEERQPIATSEDSAVARDTIRQNRERDGTRRRRSRNISIADWKMVPLTFNMIRGQADPRQLRAVHASEAQRICSR